MNWCATGPTVKFPKLRPAIHQNLGKFTVSRVCANSVKLSISGADCYWEACSPRPYRPQLTLYMSAHYRSLRSCYRQSFPTFVKHSRAVSGKMSNEIVLFDLPSRGKVCWSLNPWKSEPTRPVKFPLCPSTHINYSAPCSQLQRPPIYHRMGRVP